MKRYYIFIVIITIESMLLLWLGIKYYNLLQLYLISCSSLSYYEEKENLIEDESCIFWNMDEDSVRNRLPSPAWHGVVVIKEDSSWTPPPYERYLSKVEGTGDSVIIHSYRWHNPFSNRSDLEIIFEKIEGRWIATSCLEYNPDVVQF